MWLVADSSSVWVFVFQNVLVFTLMLEVSLASFQAHHMRTTVYKLEDYAKHCSNLSVIQYPHSTVLKWSKVVEEVQTSSLCIDCGVLVSYS